MKHGSKADWLEKLAAEGHAVPALENRPEVGPWVFYWRAFIDLSTCRAWGEQLGPIPWTAVDQWARRHGITGSRFAALNAVITGLDAIYMRGFLAQQKEAIKRGRTRVTSQDQGRRGKF